MDLFSDLSFSLQQHDPMILTAGKYFFVYSLPWSEEVVMAIRKELQRHLHLDHCAPDVYRGQGVEVTLATQGSELVLTGRYSPGPARF